MRTHVSLLLSIVFCTMVFRNHAQPVAVTDYCTLYANEKSAVYVILNDVYDSTHSISTFPIMNSGFSGVISWGGTGIMYVTPYISGPTTDTLYYMLRDMTLAIKDTGMIILNILPARNAAFLQSNDVKALVNANGYLFTDMYGNPAFEIPIGSGKSTMYTTSLMVGSRDTSGNTFILLDRYAGDSSVFIGPMDTTDCINDQPAPFEWNRVWNISAAEIEYHRFHWWEPTYTMPEVIENWPAHGDSSLNHARNLAPFIDVNQNDRYEPLSGDYPFIKGDQAVLFINHNPLNALNFYSGTIPMGLQSIGMLYAYNCETDSLISSSIFLDYTVKNMSQNTYNNTYLGIFADIDIGYFMDDYQGTFVDIQTIYGYNGDAFDDSIGSPGYGNKPPAQGITVLKNPLADPYDGIDNNDNTIIDEADETMGMYSTAIFNDVMFGGSYPYQDYYNFMRGWFNDTVPITWFTQYPSPSTGAACRYMYPGESDPSWIGTGGVAQTPDNWDEYVQSNTPGERDATMSFGPFTFDPGESKSMTLAFVYAQNNNYSYFKMPILLHTFVQKLRNLYASDNVPCGGSFSGIASSQVQSDFQLYPNPAADEVTIDLSQHFVSDKNQVVEIYDLKGQQILRIPCTAALQSIPVSGLGEGVYIVRISSSLGCTAKRLVIVR